MPDALSRIELRAIRGQEQEQDIVREAEGFGLVKGTVVENEEVARGRKLGGQVVEKELETQCSAGISRSPDFPESTESHGTSASPTPARLTCLE